MTSSNQADATSLFDWCVGACIFAAADVVVQSRPWPFLVGAIVVALFFHQIKVNWPKIKPNVDQRFASALERITSNKLNRRVVYSLLLIVFLASVGFRVYHYYHPVRPISTYKTPAPPSSSLALVKPKITWANPAPIVFGTRLSSRQLNASVDVDAAASYNHEIGETLPVGQYDLIVTFTPTDSTKYSKATQTVHLAVKKANTPPEHHTPPLDSQGVPAPQQPQPIQNGSARPADVPSPAGPTQLPSVPTPPTPITPYSEAVDALKRAQELNMGWRVRCSNAMRMYRMVNHDDKDREQAAREQAAEALQGVDNDYVERWSHARPIFDKANSDALMRLRREIAPNEVETLEGEYHRATEDAESRIPIRDLDALKNNDKRFSRLEDYFKNLKARLGEYREFPN
jgi:hypothetical protein